MAYDPEARETSNSAMIISIVAVVLVVLGALAWYATRPADLQPTTIVTNNQPAPVVAPTAIPAPDTIIVTPPATNPAPLPAPNVNSDTHVTVEQPAADTTPPPAKTPAPAGDETSSTTTTAPGDSENKMDKSTGKSDDKSGTAATPPRY